ncbi:Dabb family protein [Dermatobacter hominis]|uniref:Dabb family protein n=1 Tax=Dermatobacter hominis TaxID=2884263 RepID=UPI001D121882|nr:Dabb family protein [Dermatobacter hominis]UDY36347.1 Dabb family protein [Dermatobacter hominis]
MVRHVVLLTFVDGTSPEEVEAIATALRGLPDRIPELRSYVVGVDLDLADDNADLVVVADVDDVDGYVAYRDHPEHQRIIAEMIRPILASRTAAQHEHPA